jgi:hypothetical protein
MMWIFRIVLACGFGNARLSIALHFAVSLADVITYRDEMNISRIHMNACYALPEMDPSALACHFGDVRVRETKVRSYGLNQGLQALLASILTWCFERRTFSEAEALYLAMKSTRSSAMVHRLLSGMC